MPCLHFARPIPQQPHQNAYFLWASTDRPTFKGTSDSRENPAGGWLFLLHATDTVFPRCHVIWDGKLAKLRGGTKLGQALFPFPLSGVKPVLEEWGKDEATLKASFHEFDQGEVKSQYLLKQCQQEATRMRAGTTQTEVSYCNIQGRRPIPDVQGKSLIGAGHRTKLWRSTTVIRGPPSEVPAREAPPAPTAAATTTIAAAMARAAMAPQTAPVVKGGAGKGDGCHAKRARRTTAGRPCRGASVRCAAAPL